MYDNEFSFFFLNRIKYDNEFSFFFFKPDKVLKNSTPGKIAYI